MFADLEIGIHRRDVKNYTVDLRFISPDSETDVRLVRGNDLPLARFDHAMLRQYALDPAAYGKALTDALFADAAASAAFEQARTIAQTLDMPLRVRLFLGPSAPDLHALRWETLCLPGTTDQLATHEHIWFSRYLSSTDWRPVRMRPRGTLRVLIVVANPSDLAEYTPGGISLAPLDVEGEVARAQAGLDPTITPTVLASGGQATLDQIRDHIRDGYDIVYLAAHGAIVDDEPALWLETTTGTANVVSGDDLVRQIGKLRQRPRLLVLASCQSAGSGNSRSSGNDTQHTSQDSGILAAIGPRLSEVGIPAVLAMQDNISMQTVQTFMPRFFAELQRDGQIDRAMAVARDVVRDRPDWWVPVLFLRLKGGCIWYQPGFGSADQPAFELWPALIQNIKNDECTPILGTHVSELLGTQTEIAQRWADTHNFPLEPYRCEHLSQVAQYLTITLQPAYPYDDLLKQLKDELLQRYGDRLHADIQAQRMDLMNLLRVVGRIRREQNDADPYRVLASLDVSVYITANFTDMLTDALTDAGKDPQVVIFPWNEEIKRLPSVYDDDPDYQPTVARPLVYHLFGHLAEPDSLVITEDDYFDYVMGFAQNNDLIPPAVIKALSARGLLFLGFQPDDWDFRILFRSLTQLWQGVVRLRRRRQRINISAQIAPMDDRIQEPVRARRYLEKYLNEANIEIFWGTVDDFARELHSRAG